MKIRPAAPAPTIALSTSLASLLAASGAEAGIIHYDAEFGFTVGDGASRLIPWDINGDGSEEVDVFAATSTCGCHTIGLENFANGFGLGFPSVVGLNFAAGNSVNGDVFFSSMSSSSSMWLMIDGMLSSTLGFTSGTPGYIGFTFDPTGSKSLYGWAEVVLTEGDTFGTFEVIQWAYEDSGAGIMVGATSAVPEPETVAGGLGLLALGAAGLRRWRKQKQAA